MWNKAKDFMFLIFSEFKKKSNINFLSFEISLILTELLHDLSLEIYYLLNYHIDSRKIPNYIFPQHIFISVICDPQM